MTHAITSFTAPGELWTSIQVLLFYICLLLCRQSHARHRASIRELVAGRQLDRETSHEMATEKRLRVKFQSTTIEMCSTINLVRPCCEAPTMVRHKAKGSRRNKCNWITVGKLNGMMGRHWRESSEQGEPCRRGFCWQTGRSSTTRKAVGSVEMSIKSESIVIFFRSCWAGVVIGVAKYTLDIVWIYLKYCGLEFAETRRA